MTEQHRFFSLGLYIGGFLSSLLGIFFPAILPYLMLFYGIIGGFTLNSMKYELEKLTK